MKKTIACLAAIAVAALSVPAAASDARAAIPLKVYSWGFGGGAMYAVNDELSSDVGEVFGKLSFVNSWEFMENIALFADINWFIPGDDLDHFGIDVGVDYYFSALAFRPFVGVGVGAHYFGRDGKDGAGNSWRFADKFGASFTLHAGIALEITETTMVRLRAPCHIVMNKPRDIGAGFDISVMFMDPLRKVKKF